MLSSLLWGTSGSLLFINFFLAITAVKKEAIIRKPTEPHLQIIWFLGIQSLAFLFALLALLVP